MNILKYPKPNENNNVEVDSNEENGNENNNVEVDSNEENGF